MTVSEQVVLVVDDDLTIVTVLEYGLKAHFKLALARNAQKALELSRHYKLHAVVSDFLMPGENGHWVLAQIAREQPECRRILMSSGSVPPAAPDLVQKFFAKPVAMAALLAYLQGPTT